MSLFITLPHSYTLSYTTQLKGRKLVSPQHRTFHEALGTTETRSGCSCWKPVHYFVWTSSIGARIGGVTGIRYQELGDRKVKGLGTVYKEGKVKPKLKGFLDVEDERGIAAEYGTYARLLQECTDLKSFAEGKRVHCHMLDSGIDIGVYLGNLLITMYAKCGSMKDARQVFDKMLQRDVVSWNSIIAGYVQNGYEREALKVFGEMRGGVMQPNKFTFVSVLRACTSLVELDQGKKVHAFILNTGFMSDVTVRNALITMYSKCGSMGDANLVFIAENSNLVTWNAMIIGYAHNEQQEEALKLFCRMQQDGFVPDLYTYASTLTSCASLESVTHGEQVFAHVTKTGVELNLAVANALITMYAKHRNVEDAQKVFDRMPKRDIISWNAMIAGYAQNGYGNEVLKLIHRMQLAGMKLDFTLNQFTLPNVLRVCASLSIIDCGMELHARVIKTGFDKNVFVGSALVDMYSKCGSIKDACKMFNEMPEQNLVSWNAMIAGYVQNGHAEEALKRFCQMEQQGIKSNQFISASILKACASIKALGSGVQVHAHVIKTGVESDIFVGSALADMYAKSECVESATRVFHSMPQRNIVSWNTMIAGNVQNGHGEEALRLFCQMQHACIMPDNFNLSSILGACANLSAFGNGQQIHTFIIKTGFDSDHWVGSALVDMYAKCGSLENARTVFDETMDPDVVSFTVMIAAYAQHGNGKEALQLFEQMQMAGMRPDHVTFTSVLSACSQEGLVSKGREYFHAMHEGYGVTPREEHYACMVNLLGRAGCLEEAESFIKEMPFEPSAMVWQQLLVACRYHGDTERGNLAAENILKMEPENPYLLLSNMHTAAGRLEDVAKVQNVMKEREVRIEPGRSCIEIKNRVHTFRARDKSHPQTEEIYSKLEELTKQMKEAGYAFNTKFLLYELEDEQNEQHHSEKLAVAFGLITMPPGVPIRIVKNCHVCDDCHSTMKFISNVVRQEIVLRDLNCFHHFKHGRCSCGDYW